MLVIDMIKEEYSKGNILVFYTGSYLRRLKFKKKKRRKDVTFDLMKYYKFEESK